MARGPAWATVMPGKTARALCPVCQEPMPPDETECENCGAFVIDEAVVRLSRAFGIPREKALALFEKGFRHPKQLQDKDVDDVLRRGEGGLLYICTNCGGFVAAGDAKCARCGAEFEEEAEEPPEEKDILDQVLCPVCGADNDPAWRECEICGEPLNGTEPPPGEVLPEPAPPAEARPPQSFPVATTHRDHATDPHALEVIDGILKELDTPSPAKTAPAIRPVQKVAKRMTAKKPIPRPAPAPASPPKERPISPTKPRVAPPPRIPARPTPRRTIRPVPRPAPAETPHPKAPASPPPTQKPAPRVPPKRRIGWVTPPPEFTGGVVIAAAAALYTLNALGEIGMAWGVSFALAILSLYLLVTSLSRRSTRVGHRDGALLATGALLSALAPVVPASVAPILTAAGVIPLALATRRLLKAPAKDLLVVASSLPLTTLGIAAAMGFAFAATPAWAFGLLAATPWPAAVVAQGIWQKRSSLALRRELTKAERDAQREDYAQSLKDYDRAITLSSKGGPGEDVPWYGKGATLILLGRYDEALRAIDVALDLNPRNEVAWLNKGNALTKMGRLVDALRCFNAAIKVNPRYEVAWNNKGNTLARLGHYEEALKCYGRALDIDPSYRGAWVNKGYVLTKLGRYEEATSCADRALRLSDRVPPEAV